MFNQLRFYYCFLHNRNRKFLSKFIVIHLSEFFSNSKKSFFQIIAVWKPQARMTPAARLI